MRSVLHNTHVSARGQVLTSTTASGRHVTWMIDGAHTPRSIAEVCKWVEKKGVKGMEGGFLWSSLCRGFSSTVVVTRTRLRCCLSW